MSAGMTAHHSCGFAVTSAAAASTATTTVRRIAILRAQTARGIIRIEIPP
jgi:hypothetical protein